MASRTRSSSLAASPSAASRTSSALGGSSSRPPPLPVTSATARETDSSIGAGVVAVGALDEHAELVEHRAVAAGGEDVEQRLRGEDLPDRRGERRPAGLGPDPHDLRQRVEQAVAGGVRAEVDVERGDEPGRKVVLGGANGDPRCDGRDGLVADVLVDRSAASHSGAVSTPVSRPSPWSASTSDSPETRCRVSASG